MEKTNEEHTQDNLDIQFYEKKHNTFSLWIVFSLSLIILYRIVRIIQIENSMSSYLLWGSNVAPFITLIILQALSIIFIILLLCKKKIGYWGTVGILILSIIPSYISEELIKTIIGDIVTVLFITGILQLKKMV